MTYIWWYTVTIPRRSSLEYMYNVPISMGIFRTVPYAVGISTTEIIRRIIDAGA